MPFTTILRNREWMFDLERDEAGVLHLNVLVGQVGMYEVRVRLGDEEVARYEEAGESYLIELSRAIAAEPSACRDRD